MSGVISFYSGRQIRLTRIISRAIINQNHQHFQNVFIVQFDFEGPSVVAPGLTVVSGGSVGGLRSVGGLTGFKHAEYDSKFTRVSRTVARFSTKEKHDLDFESMPGHISPKNGSPRLLSIQT